MMATKPDLNIDQGFVSKPYAIQKTIQNPDGSFQTIFVDAKTGKQVNPKGYQVIQQKDVPDTTKEAVQVQQNIAAPNVDNQTTNAEILLGKRDATHSSVQQAVDANKSNQGYVDRPSILGLSGFLPTPLALAGLATSVGMNVNNQKAISDQRQALGFTDTTTGQKVGGALFDTNGYIGEAQITRSNGTQETVPVSFEAADKYNRTTLTPEEARKRELISQNLEEATAAQRNAAIGTFNNQFPEQQSFTQKMIQAARGLFGGTSVTPSGGNTTGTGFNTGTGSAGAYSSTSFPDAPSPPTNTSTGLDTGRGPNVDTSGMSPGLY